RYRTPTSQKSDSCGALRYRTPHPQHPKSDDYHTNSSVYQESERKVLCWKNLKNKNLNCMKQKVKQTHQNVAQLSLVLDYKDALHQIRNYLAGQMIGATRDETLLEEVIKCLFCKIYLKKHQNIVINPDTKLSIQQQYQKTFSEIQILLPNLFNSQDKLQLDKNSLEFVDQKLEILDIHQWSYDPFGDAYEVFTSSIVKGKEGQFFTPQNAIDLLVELINPQPGETIIDPACGAGGFLNSAARHLINLGITSEEVNQYVFGIDKDNYLVRLASARLSLFTKTSANIFCGDSLAWDVDKSLQDKLGTFDIVLANPPFGTRIVAASGNTQRTFELGYKWHLDKKSDNFIKSNELQSSVPPQVLFIERCLSLVKPGGRLGIVVPESLISSKTYRYVINYIEEKADIKAVIGMPEELFKVSGKSGTHTKTCLLVLHKKKEANIQQKNNIFMADAKLCGHDSRGRKNSRDDLPTIALNYHKYRQNNLVNSSLGYEVEFSKITDYILAPRYYNPEIINELQKLHNTHDLIPISELISQGLLDVTTGDEVGKENYGTGDIPFVRTSDISNWEIKRNPKHCLSEEIYRSLAVKQDVREGDILMVRDGTYLVGHCAYITKYDKRIVFQSHIYKLRIKDNSKLSAYLLIAALSSEPVIMQIKAKRFTQDIIDSLGDRLGEIILPIPKDCELKEKITQIVKRSIDDRIEARELARQACVELVS
ncbi:N-6 DNA methylase, partial [Dolichospermum sp. ST_sed9]|nr:N-6 DNA methylase [Dolichospermum sp. ST_sed9]